MHIQVNVDEYKYTYIESYWYSCLCMCIWKRGERKIQREREIGREEERQRERKRKHQTEREKDTNRDRFGNVHQSTAGGKRHRQFKTPKHRHAGRYRVAKIMGYPFDKFVSKHDQARLRQMDRLTVRQSHGDRQTETDRTRQKDRRVYTHKHMQTSTHELPSRSTSQRIEE